MDVVLVGFVGAYIVAGWRTGFLRRLIGLGFLALSFVGGAYLRHPIGALVATFVKGVPASYTEMIGYVIVFPAILVALHVVTYRLVGHAAMSGLSRTTDQALGAIFGGAEAVLIVSAAIVILDTFFGTKGSAGQAANLGFVKQLSASLDGSTTAHLLRGTTVPAVLGVLGPLLPKDVASLVSGALPAGLPTGLPGGVSLPNP